MFYSNVLDLISWNNKKKRNLNFLAAISKNKMEQSSEVKPIEDKKEEIPKTEEKLEEGNVIDLGIAVKIAEPLAERVIDTGIAISGGLGLIPVSGHPFNNMYYIVNRENPTGTMNNRDMNLVRSDPQIREHQHDHEHDHYHEDSDSPPSIDDTDDTDDNDEYVSVPFIPGPNPNFGNPLLRQPTFHQPFINQPALHQATQIGTNPLTLHSLIQSPNNNEQNLTNLHATITGSNPPDPNNPQVRISDHPLTALREAMENAQRNQKQTENQVESSGRRENIAEPNANRRPPSLSEILQQQQQPRQNNIVADSLSELGRLFPNIQLPADQNRNNQEDVEPENTIQRLTRELSPHITSLINQNGGFENFSNTLIETIRNGLIPPQNNQEPQTQNNQEPQVLPRPQPIGRNPIPRTPTPDDFLPMRRRANNVARRLFDDERPIIERATPVRRPTRLIPADEVQEQIDQAVRAAENRVLLEVERRNGASLSNFGPDPRLIVDRGWNIERNTIRNINLAITLLSILQGISLLFVGALAIKNSDYFWITIMFMAIFATGYVLIGHLKGRKSELHGIVRRQKTVPSIIPINGRNAERVINAERARATARVRTRPNNETGDLEWSEDSIDNNDDNSV